MWHYQSRHIQHINSGTVTTISVGLYCTCAVKTDGTAQCWGHDSDGQVTVPADRWVQLVALVVRENTPVQSKAMVLPNVGGIILMAEAQSLQIQAHSRLSALVGITPVQSKPMERRSAGGMMVLVKAPFPTIWDQSVGLVVVDTIPMQSQLMEQCSAGGPKIIVVRTMFPQVFSNPI